MPIKATIDVPATVLKKNTPRKVPAVTYVNVNLHVNIRLQLNKETRRVSLFSMQAIESKDTEQADVRVSDISGYTAGSSKSGSSHCATHVGQLQKPRMSEASFSSSSTSPEIAKLQKMSRKRVNDLKKKYGNSELLYEILNYIDNKRAVKVGDSPEIQHKGQIRLASKHLFSSDRKRIKLDNIQENLPVYSGKYLFAKPSAASKKYLPCKSYKQLDSGKLCIELYTGDIKEIPSSWAFTTLLQREFEKTVMFELVMENEKTVPVQALILKSYLKNEQPWFHLITDHGEFDRVHITSIYLTSQIIAQMKSFEQQGVQEGSSGIKHELVSGDTSESSEPDFSSMLIPGCEEETIFYVPYIDDKIKAKNIMSSMGDSAIVGPLNHGSWFTGLAFILTCSKDLVSMPNEDVLSEDERFVFSTVPYVKSRLEHQIKLGGGRVFEGFQEVPEHMRHCLYLVAPRPCLTAKYIESLAADVKIVCHQWVIDCNKNCTRLPIQELPLGWSLEEQRFINSYQRETTQPFADLTLNIPANRKSSFSNFWGRILTMCGGKVLATRYLNDTTIVITDGLKATTLPVGVSVYWVIQSIIHGAPRNVSAHPSYELDLA